MHAFFKIIKKADKSRDRCPVTYTEASSEGMTNSAGVICLTADAFCLTVITPIPKFAA